MPSPPIPSSSPTHYELLQLPVTASLEELRQAFRQLSKRYHPDTTTLPAPQAEESFRLLRHAYAVLSDPLRREAYDAQLRQRTAALVLPRALANPTQVQARLRPDSVRRALSGGEWFALLLLGVALVLSLVLGIGVAWMRGAELVQRPSWWGELQGPPLPLPLPAPAAAADAALPAAP
jgi:DnaJ-domain-containing protein 1